MPFQVCHQLCDEGVAVPDPDHCRDAPEKAVEQIDTASQIELEAAVVPEDDAEQQLTHGAADILICAAHHEAEQEDGAVAPLLAAPQQDRRHDQRQPPHHAEGSPHEARAAHPDARRHPAEQRLHHVAEESPDDKEPDEVAEAQSLFFLNSRLRLDDGRVSPLDTLFHMGDEPLTQLVRVLFQLEVELFQPRMAGGVPVDGQRCAQLVEDGQRHRRPDADMQQPARQQGAEPQQQDVAPQHTRHAQQAPEHRVLQADVAVQIELFI